MSDYDLKGYLLGELNAAERKAVEAALAADAGLREELARLKGTVALLRSVPDEEPPRRIAFVSDKSIAPTPWWKRIWNSAPQLGFLSAALLAGAIMVNAWTRPVPQIVLLGFDGFGVRRGLLVCKHVLDLRPRGCDLLSKSGGLGGKIRFLAIERGESGAQRLKLAFRLGPADHLRAQCGVVDRAAGGKQLRAGGFQLGEFRLLRLAE
ncbi:MAG: hypothetical protein MUC42_16470, partial [Bryobacter sp.]|nr:hypothetical protein [Bryobacter sp.]